MAELLGYISVPGRKYLDKGGKERTEWHRAGAAFEATDGVNGEVYPGMSISGRFIIRPAEEKPAKTQAPEGSDDGADFLEER
jgi:hypothetical protein